MLRYKKIHRTFIRFYLSDQPLTVEALKDGGVWTTSINYNDYRFSVDQQNEGNYMFYLYPTEVGKSIGNVEIIKPRMQSIEPLMNQSQNTNVYRRAYQLPIPQQRAVEFVFELKRRWTEVTTDLINADTDRLIKAGYYFLLSGIWVDYSDRAGI
jgi:hypothetical protein